MDKKETPYIVCIGIEDYHHPRSLRVKCVECGKDLWCSIWNKDKRPICWDCVNAQKDVKFLITEKDLIETAKEIERKNL